MLSTDFTPGRPLRFYQENGKFIDFSTDDLVGKKLNNFQNWFCGAGLQNLFVDMDGNVFGASCRVGGSLGNVFDEIKIPKDWIVCPRKLCSCCADLFIPKARTNADKLLLRKTFETKSVEAEVSINSQQFSAIERTHAAGEKQIYWEIGRRCNYNCSYCWPWIHNKTDNHKSLLEFISATNNILENFSGIAPVNFIISGGEPTLNPDFLDWARYISSLGHSLSMHSNGSRLPDYYRELIHAGNLNISVHFEFYNQEKILNVIEAITQEKVKEKNIDVGHLEVKLMMAPGRRVEALSMVDKLFKIPFFKEYCTWAYVPIRDGNMGDQIMNGYDEKDFNLFGPGAAT